MFVSAVRSAKDLAGVFEHDGDVGWFYLHDDSMPADRRILGAIHVLSREPDVCESDVQVRWSRDEAAVGLFIRGRLRAAFSGSARYGGDLCGDEGRDVPSEVAALFEAC